MSANRWIYRRELSLRQIIIRREIETSGRTELARREPRAQPGATSKPTRPRVLRTTGLRPVALSLSLSLFLRVPKADERRIKTFVRHRLTLDSAEHRNSRSPRNGGALGSRGRRGGEGEGEGEGGSYSERPLAPSRERGGGSVSGYARCRILRAMQRPLLATTRGRRTPDAAPRRRFSSSPAPLPSFPLSRPFHSSCRFAVRSFPVSPLSAVERGKVPIVNPGRRCLALARPSAPGQRAKGGILARCQKRLGTEGTERGERRLTVPVDGPSPVRDLSRARVGLVSLRETSRDLRALTSGRPEEAWSDTGISKGIEIAMQSREHAITLASNLALLLSQHDVIEGARCI